MLLFPKGFKYIKTHCYLPQSYETESKKIKLLRGTVGVKAIQSGHLTANQIEAFRRVVIRSLRQVRGSKLWICVFPFLALTKKPNGVRMGKGKGEPFIWVATIKKGKILFEIGGMSTKMAINVLKHAKTKLSLKTIIILND
jgi:large subunit ribosomal protein L16